MILAIITLTSTMSQAKSNYAVAISENSQDPYAECMEYARATKPDCERRELTKYCLTTFGEDNRIENANYINLKPDHEELGVIVTAPEEGEVESNPSGERSACEGLDPDKCDAASLEDEVIDEKEFFKRKGLSPDILNGL